MCRLAYFPKEFVENIPEEFIIDFLKNLEAMNGGDGNGFYYLESGRLEKSVDLTIDDLYNNPRKEAFLFHTRRRSHGPINDFLCHPFETENYVILHNGIWYEYKHFERLFKNKKGVSDSYIMSEVIELMGIQKFFQNYSHLGVVLIYHKKSKRVFCAYTSGEFQAMKTKYGYIFASNFGYHKYINSKSFRYLRNICIELKQYIPYGFFELNTENLQRINLENIKIENFDKITSTLLDEKYEILKSKIEEINCKVKTLTIQYNAIMLKINSLSVLMDTISKNLGNIKQDISEINKFIKNKNNSIPIQNKMTNFNSERETALVNKSNIIIDKNKEQATLSELIKTHKELKFKIEKEKMKRIKRKVIKNGKISFNV
ncbi:MAG: hypothetical protein ACTSQP_05760 [Promethearchaeota archaeon]